MFFFNFLLEYDSFTIEWNIIEGVNIKFQKILWIDIIGSPVWAKRRPLRTQNKLIYLALVRMGSLCVLKSPFWNRKEMQNRDNWKCYASPTMDTVCFVAIVYPLLLPPSFDTASSNLLYYSSRKNCEGQECVISLASAIR